MWSVLKKFIELSSYQQEVVDNIVEGKVDMYEISARDIAFQVCTYVYVTHTHTAHMTS